MKPPFIQSLKLDGFLSFAPNTDVIELRPLNVLIGPNGSGKSNFLEALSLLSSLPAGEQFQSRLRMGGGPDQWLWNGGKCDRARFELTINNAETSRNYRYQLAFAPRGQGATFIEESFEEINGTNGALPRVLFRITDKGVEVATKFIGPEGLAKDYTLGIADRHFFRADTSLLSQRSNPDSYPDTAWLATQFSRIHEFRDWTFGGWGAMRRAQQTLLPTDALLPDGSNLAMLVQDFEHRGALSAFEPYLKRFLPRFERLSTRVSGGTIMLYLHEEGVLAPIPASRISDGTLRFIALLTVLLSPTPPPVVCIEEPELGIHPDALDLLAELLVEASGRSQIIVTTHADGLVSELTEHLDSVLVCEHLGGGTVMSRLEKEKLDFWLDKYRLGDLWRIGVLGGNP